MKRMAGGTRLGASNPWVQMTVVMAGTIMVVLDTTIVNVALHQIGLDLRSSAGIEWIVSAYLLAVCASQPITGWLADRIGRKATFMLSLAAFTGASMACAAAPNLGALIGFRVVQGLGGGALVPVGMTMVLELFPKERHGRAIAVWGMAAMMAPAVGPTLGGWLVTSVNWRYLFLINVPIGVAAFVAAIPLLPSAGNRHRRPLDVIGVVLGSGGLSLLVLGLSQANRWGWTSGSILVCLAAGALAIVVFTVHELRTDHPMIQLRMLGDRSFRLSIGTMVFIFMAQFARLVFVPLELESLRNDTALTVGVLFLPAALAGAAGMSAGGRLVDRLGPRPPIIMGCSTVLVALVSFSHLSITTPLVVICALLSIQGLGVGLVSAPAMVAGLSDLPPNLMAQGSALRSLMSQVSGALAVAAFGAVVAARMGSHPSPAHAQSAYNGAFVAASIGVAISLVLAFRLPSRPRAAPAEFEESLALAAD